MREPVVGWVLALVLVVAIHAVGLVFMQGWALDLGSLVLPVPRLAVLFGLQATLGAAAVALAARAWADRLPGARIADGWVAIPDRTWCVVGSAAAFVSALAVHALVLRGMSVTDDESAYLFMARTLATGHLTAPSPEPRLFFDRAFMINDGRLYAQYFLGWPALLAPFAAVGLDGLANPLCFAAMVPGVFLVLRRLGAVGGTAADGALAARVGVVLCVTSPMLVLSAATRMSHASCALALVWCAWFALRSRDPGSAWYTHAGVGLCFAVAFFIRPLSAVGAGLPLLVAWGLGVFVSRRPRDVLAFVVPAAALAACFLLVNLVQNGGITVVSYQRMIDYARDNGFRFSHFHPDTDVVVAGFRSYGLIYGVALNAVGMLRLAWDLFGWPFGLALAALAGLRGERGLVTASWVCFFVCSLFQVDAGVDAFGPVHFAEAAPGLLMGAALAVQRAHRLFATGTSLPSLQAAPMATLVSLVAVGLLVYAPVRAGAMRRMSAEVEAPFRLVASSGITDAVIFAPRPITPGCIAEPTGHFVFWRPNNPPDLASAPVWWVNHVDIAEDRRFMAGVPGRRGYVLTWDDACVPALVPVDDPAADAIPAQEQRLAPLMKPSPRKADGT